jgi:hypothetical protein
VVKEEESSVITPIELDTEEQPTWHTVNTERHGGTVEILSVCPSVEQVILCDKVRDY